MLQLGKIKFPQRLDVPTCFTPSDRETCLT